MSEPKNFRVIWALLALGLPLLLGAKGCENLWGGHPPCKGKHCGGGGGGGGGSSGGSSDVCGTRGGVSCDEGEFCKLGPDCGATDRGGVCTAIPEVCTEIYAPVCGCDGETYSSACNANSAGVSVQHKGKCASTGQTCGGIASLECDDGEFCNYEPAAGGQGCDGSISDAAGKCETIPEACTKEYRPVCGCDNQTYGNLCEAHAHGVSALHDGACASPGKTCGGIAALTCEKDQFCNYEPAAGGQGCDGSIADAAGKCETRPEICPAIYKPVCGCDHKSYGSSCEAHAAGASVLHEGACTEIDCKAIGGHAVDGFGPPPQCAEGEVNYTWIAYSNGMIAIEGTACCVPE